MKGRSLMARAGFALSGLAAAWRHEASFRSQVLLAVAAVALLAFLQPALVWWGLATLVIAAILAAELLNTALEHLCDLLHPAEHPSVKLIKDCAAAAVLLLSLAALVLLVLIFVAAMR